MPPAYPSTGISLDAPIDLISSDDEESSSVSLPMAARRSGPQTPPILPSTVPFSHHGLILPGTFQGIIDGRKNASKNLLAPQRQNQTQTSRILPPQRYLQLYPNAQDNRNIKAYKGASTLGSQRVDVANPAKRRKLDISSVSKLPKGASAIYPPILPPERRNSSAQPLRKESLILPPRNRQSLPGTIGQQKVQVKAQPGRNSDALSRAIQPNKRQSDKTVSREILRHVHRALRSHRQILSKEELDKIGSYAVAKLLDSKIVLENFQEGDFVNKIERELSNQAEQLVNTLVANNAYPPLVKQSIESKTDAINTPTSGNVLLPKVQQNGQGSVSQRNTSEYSTEEETIFDKPLVRQERLRPSRLQRQYSSSPTTSWSTELPEPDTSAGPGRLKPATNDIQRSSRSRSSTNRLKAQDISSPVISGAALRVRLSNSGNQLLTKSEPATLSKAQSSQLTRSECEWSRPYLSHTDRENTRRGLDELGEHLSAKERQLLQSTVLHIDFCAAEVEFVCDIIRGLTGSRSPQIVALMKNPKSSIDRICAMVKDAARKSGGKDQQRGRLLLQNRSGDSIRSFLEDASTANLPTSPQTYRIKPIPRRRLPPLSALLRERETWGMAPHRVGLCKQPFEVEVSSRWEDSLVSQSEWTDCCGDIAAISWTSSNAFICGATAHSDYHNMQYNKPGNLLVGSAPLDSLKSIPGHKIIRPIVSKVENAENALESMRRTQDPWLYTSVVSTAHSDACGHTFTASFDRTVKIWKVAEDGSSMNFCGSWDHHGNVNFVITSEHHDRVATAADVSSSAVRVYAFDESCISLSAYDTYDCDRALSQTLEPGRVDKWAYFPATIAWGRAPSVQPLLLVGYSPRSLTSEESDIPEDKKNSGELCLWNVIDGTRVLISSAKTQNVFEVLWHPTQPIFLAATSPTGTYEPDVRTQIRLFAQNETGTFMHIKALDCSAFDINELTIMPNSAFECYVTASCTDGKTYVWDTAQGDRPIHTLGHGDSLDNPLHDLPREIADTGVKFAAWGKTADRFYTGSSDGKVKAWDIQAPRGEAFVRTVLTVSGGISVGAFSKDFSKLLIGDATGMVHLLGIKDGQADEDNTSGGVDHHPQFNSTRDARRTDGTSLAKSLRKAPKVITPHDEPEPPAGYEVPIPAVVEQSAQDIARGFLEDGHLVLLNDRRIGVVQGPNYIDTMLYRYEAHEMEDASLPLLPEWQQRQQCETTIITTDLSIPVLPAVESSDPALHEKNIELDLDISKLSLSTQDELLQERVDLAFDHEHNFDFETSPRQKIFRAARNKSRANNPRASLDVDGDYGAYSTFG